MPYSKTTHRKTFSQKLSFPKILDFKEELWFKKNMKKADIILNKHATTSRNQTLQKNIK